MTKEEEGAGLSRALSTLEDLTEVVYRVQRFLNRSHVQVVQLVQGGKLLVLIEKNADAGLNSLLLNVQQLVRAGHVRVTLIPRVDVRHIVVVKLQSGCAVAMVSKLLQLFDHLFILVSEVAQPQLNCLIHVSDTFKDHEYEFHIEGRVQEKVERLQFIILCF